MENLRQKKEKKEKKEKKDKRKDKKHKKKRDYSDSDSSSSSYSSDKKEKKSKKRVRSNSDDEKNAKKSKVIEVKIDEEKCEKLLQEIYEQAEESYHDILVMIEGIIEGGKANVEFIEDSRMRKKLRHLFRAFEFEEMTFAGKKYYGLPSSPTSPTSSLPSAESYKIILSFFNEISKKYISPETLANHFTSPPPWILTHFLTPSQCDSLYSSHQKKINTDHDPSFRTPYSREQLEQSSTRSLGAKKCDRIMTALLEHAKGFERTSNL